MTNNMTNCKSTRLVVQLVASNKVTRGKTPTLRVQAYSYLHNQWKKLIEIDQWPYGPQIRDTQIFSL